MENENTLPALQKQVDSEIVKASKEDNIYFVKMQGFSRLLNKPVEGEKLEEHPIAKGVKYLPISFIEMALDTLYFGLWEAYDYKSKLIINEMEGIITLRVFHPVAKVWLRRAGVAAKAIMTDSVPDELKFQNGDSYKIKDEKRQGRNKWALNPDNKKPAALEMGGSASLRSLAIKNAALSLGKYFGRDVNRDHIDTYHGIVESLSVKINKYRTDLSDALDICQDEKLKETVVAEVLEAETNAVNTPELYKKLIAKLVKTFGDED